jgi:hypothetical protein
VLFGVRTLQKENFFEFFSFVPVLAGISVPNGDGGVDADRRTVLAPPAARAPGHWTAAPARLPARRGAATAATSAASSAVSMRSCVTRIHLRYRN